MPKIIINNPVVRQGKWISNSFTIPANAKGVVKFAIDMPLNERRDIAKFMDFKIELLDAIGWKFFAGFTWQGGIDEKDGVQATPGVEFDISEIAGKVIRINVDVPNAVNIGANLEY